MLNDYLWTRLYAQREEELRARARRRWGHTASPVRPSLRTGRRRGLRLGRRLPAATPHAVVAKGRAA